MTADPFDRDATVAHGAAEAVAPGVRRVVAANPSPMTFTGTNTYIVGDGDGGGGGGGGPVVVIDPGPDLPDHRAAVLAALAGARVAAVLITHAHADHCAGARALAQAVDAPVMASGAPRPAPALPDLGGGEGADPAFAPDAALEDGQAVQAGGLRLTALATPGHRWDHLCFAVEGTGLLFSGDHVMGWSTTLVSPPDGEMAAFMASLAGLRARAAAGTDRLLLPGHGRPVADPLAMIDWQIAHRRDRERQVLEALRDGPADAAALAARIYRGLAPALLPAAARNVLAHLLALQAAGAVAAEGTIAAHVPFRRLD
jgi:glyoxylase-like metal-dependent hydrolase (beta-lactamase superfamily II)